MYNCVRSFCEGLHRMELKSLSLKNSRRPCKGTSPVMSYVKESCFTSHKSAFCEVSSHSKCWLTPPPPRPPRGSTPLFGLYNKLQVFAAEQDMVLRA